MIPLARELYEQVINNLGVVPGEKVCLIIERLCGELIAGWHSPEGFQVIVRSPYIRECAILNLENIVQPFFQKVISVKKGGIISGKDVLFSGSFNEVDPLFVEEEGDSPISGSTILKVTQEALSKYFAEWAEHTKIKEDTSETITLFERLDNGG